MRWSGSVLWRRRRRRPLSTEEEEEEQEEQEEEEQEEQEGEIRVLNALDRILLEFNRQ